MFSIASLIDRAKVGGNIESDYRLAKIIGINQSAFGNYKAGRNLPDERVLSQLCALSGDDVAVMAAQIQAERARTSEGKTLWLMIAARLKNGATAAILSVLFTIGLIAAPVDSARASTVSEIKSDNLIFYTSYKVAFLSVGLYLQDKLRRLPTFFFLYRMFQS
jgi:hypothetical protein